MQELFKSEVLGLARQFKLLLVEVLHVPFLELVWYVGLSLLGEDLLPLVLAHLLSHPNPPRLGVVHLGGHEGLRLGLLGGQDLP